MAEALCARQIDCMASVATEYGREVMRQQEHLVIREGRMGEPEMEELMRTGTFLAVVDATHPYAVEVTEHIKESAKKTNLPYLRLSRSTAAEREIAEHEWMIHTVADTQECVELLSKLNCTHMPPGRRSVRDFLCVCFRGWRASKSATGNRFRGSRSLPCRDLLERSSTRR